MAKVGDEQRVERRRVLAPIAFGHEYVDLERADALEAVVAAAISAERLAPAGMRVARVIGAVIVGTGLFLIARAVRVG